MDAQLVLILLIVGLVAGILGGLVGIGGGIVIVPALVYFLGYSQKMAQGTSLGILLLPVGILAVWQFHRQEYVSWHAVWLVALGFVLGGYVGSRIALSLPQDTVKKIFAIMLILIAFKMLFLDKKIKEVARTNETATVPRAPQDS
ncbi:sulfite exporter TauE/SafE family protein [Flaviaesturariibacter aridisoli]|uniref:Probable membrane transporter protein n=1 Tax=Flaviaesturariibacter aridisoli TaxID=2545761 RepID=A0A4R4DVA2_9BACT|nr:sulfite exporter TauE/SafE family protein [Flaviaesturariibacter aridisoli]TCZ67343.1 sulfite exporter TauE/SafE family protein [Flaviaesturariibacter aridisoli]